MRNTRGRGGNK